MKSKKAFLAFMVALPVQVAPDVSLTKAPNEIRSYLLGQTPLGSTPDAVLEYVRREFPKGGWKNGRRIEPYYDSMNPCMVHAPKPASDGQPTVGQRSVMVELGWHFTRDWELFFLPTRVFACWAFDERNRLSEVVVSKEVDGP